MLWKKSDPLGQLQREGGEQPHFPAPASLQSEAGAQVHHQLNAHLLELQAALKIRSDKLIQSVEISVGSVRIQIMLFSSLTLKKPTKNNFFSKFFLLISF
jgi:hypothetical protein